MAGEPVRAAARNVLNPLPLVAYVYKLIKKSPSYGGDSLMFRGLLTSTKFYVRQKNLFVFLSHFTQVFVAAFST